MEEGSARGLRVAILCDDDDTGKTLLNASKVLQHFGHQVDIYASTALSDRTGLSQEQTGVSNVYSITPAFSAKPSNDGALNQRPLIQYVQHLYVAWGAFLTGRARRYDVFLVSTSVYAWVPALRVLANRRLVLYYAQPDDAMEDWEFDDAQLGLPVQSIKRRGFLSKLYRIPIEWAQGWAMSHADVILANSHLATRLFCSRFPSQQVVPRVVYPCSLAGMSSDGLQRADDVVDTTRVTSNRPTFLALGTFNHASNLALSIRAFARLKQWQTFHRDRQQSQPLRAHLSYAVNAPIRLVIAGRYNPHSRDDLSTLNALQPLASTLNLPYAVIHPEKSPLASTTNADGEAGNANVAGEKGASVVAEKQAERDDVDVLFLPNITPAQRMALLDAQPPLLSPPNLTYSNVDSTAKEGTSSSSSHSFIEPTGTLAVLSTISHAPFSLGYAEEAMLTHGTPVLACETSGSAEIIVDPAKPLLPLRGDTTATTSSSNSTPGIHTPYIMLDERTGWLRPADADAWAGAMRDILLVTSASFSPNYEGNSDGDDDTTTEWHRIRTRCQARAESRFSPAIVGPQFERALFEAVQIEADLDPESDGERGESWWVFWTTCYVLGFFLVWVVDMHEIE